MKHLMLLIIGFFLASCSSNILRGNAVPKNIIEAINEKLPGVVLSCHRRELGPPLKDVNYHIETSFLVNGYGKVERMELVPVASEAESPLGSTFDCIKRRFRKATFPKAPKGKRVEIRRDINFATLFE